MSINNFEQIPQNSLRDQEDSDTSQQDMYWNTDKGPRPGGGGEWPRNTPLTAPLTPILCNKVQYQGEDAVDLIAPCPPAYLHSTHC